MDNVITLLLIVWSVILVISLITVIVDTVAFWRIFVKAGEDGWKALIPFYNVYTSFKIAGMPDLFKVYIAFTVLSSIAVQLSLPFLIYSIISLLSLALSILSNYRLSKSFGCGVGMTVGLMLAPPVFACMLAFGKYEYIGADTIEISDIIDKVKIMFGK